MLKLNNFNTQRIIIIALFIVSVIWFLAQPDYEPAIAAMSYILSLVALYSNTENTGTSGKIIRPEAKWFVIPAVLIGLLFFLLSLGRLNQITNSLFEFFQSLLSQNIFATLILCYVAGFLGVALVGSQLETGSGTIRIAIESVIGLIISTLISILALFSSTILIIPVIFFTTITSQGSDYEAEVTNGINIAAIASSLLMTTVAAHLISIKHDNQPALSNKVRGYFSVVFSSILVAALSQDISIMVISVIIGTIAFLIARIVWRETNNRAETNIVTGAFIGFSIGAFGGGRTMAILCLIGGPIVGYILAHYHAKYSTIISDVVDKVYFDE